MSKYGKLDGPVVEDMAYLDEDVARWGHQCRQCKERAQRDSEKEECQGEQDLRATGKYLMQ